MCWCAVKKLLTHSLTQMSNSRNCRPKCVNVNVLNGAEAVFIQIHPERAVVTEISKAMYSAFHTPRRAGRRWRMGPVRRNVGTRVCCSVDGRAPDVACVHLKYNSHTKLVKLSRCHDLCPAWCAYDLNMVWSVWTVWCSVYRPLVWQWQSEAGENWEVGLRRDEISIAN